MAILENTRCYLSGPIEHDETNFNWRLEPKKVLVNEFKVDLFDPFADPKQQWVPAILKAKEEKDYELIADIARRFVRKDLCMVDRSDFLIAYLPEGVLTTGTHHEIVTAVNAKKPTLLVTNRGDITHLPLWYFGFIPTEAMFSSWDALYDYLKSVDQGEQKHNDKWSFIYGDV